MNDGAIIIDSRLDSDELLKAIQELLEKVKKFGGDAAKQFGTLDKAVENTGKKAAKLKIEPTTEGIQAAVRDLDILNAKIETQEGLLGEYQHEYERLASRFGETSEQALKVQKKVLAAESAISKMTKQSDALAGAISDAEDAMKDGGKAAEDTGEKTKDMGKKAKDAGDDLRKSGDGAIIFQHALGDLLAQGLEKVISATGDLLEKTREYRSDMSKLRQNARDANVSFGLIESSMKTLNFITGETDSNVEALSNLIAAGFKENQIVEAMDAIAGAYIKFPDTMKIESLADSLQETIATKEATGQFAELLGRVGINVDDYNKGLQRASKNGKAQEYVLKSLARTGLAEVKKGYEDNNKELKDYADAQFDLNEKMSYFSTQIEPIVSKSMDVINKLLEDHKDDIDAIIDSAVIIANEVIPSLAEGIGDLADKLAPLLNLTQGIVEGLDFINSLALTAFTGNYKYYKETTDEDFTNILLWLKQMGYAKGTASAARGLHLVGERGPELVDFRGGERVYNATQTLAMQAMAGGPQYTYVDNTQNIFKVDDIATYVQMEKRLRSEKQSRRMGYVSRP